MVGAKNGVARADFGRFDEIRGAVLTLDRANRGRTLRGICGGDALKYNYIDFKLASARSSFWMDS
jgi:hypothetical protein